jgi:integrase
MAVRRKCSERNCKNGRRCLEHLRFDVTWRGHRYRMPVNDFAIPRMEPGKQRPIQSMEEARDWERLFIGEIKAGRDPRRGPSRPTHVNTQIDNVAAFLHAYVERCVRPAGLRSINAIYSRVGVLKQYLGHLPLSALEEPDDVNRFKTDSDYAEDVELATIHRVLETLRAAINWGMAQTPPLFAKSPFHRFGVRLNKKAETVRDRRLSREEERRLLDTALGSMNTPEHQFAGPILHDRIIGALELCCRRGEMLLIQNKRVNWDTCQIGIPGATAKDKENRRIPFTRTDAWRPSLSDGRNLVPTPTCSAARTARISRTSRPPGTRSGCSPSASRQSRERRVRHGTRSSFGASTCGGTTFVTKGRADCSRMASTSESFS